MRETLTQRIDFLIAFSKGTMPIGILAADDEEAARAVAIIAKKRSGKIVKVYVRKNGEDVEFNQEQKVWNPKKSLNASTGKL